MTKFIYTSKIHLNQRINYLLTEEEKKEIKKIKNLKIFIDHSQTIVDVHENLEDYNLTKKRKVLIVFDDVIADMKSNKNLSPIVTELCLRGRILTFHSFLYQKLTSECLKL